MRQADLSRLRRFVYGISLIPVELVRKGIAVLSRGFAQVDGLTESIRAITHLPPLGDHTEAEGEGIKSGGEPMIGVELRVVDSAGGAKIAAGQVSEILFRSTQNMKGLLEPAA